jgi:hypothetical protein
MDEMGNAFSIKGSYNLNCKELHNFSYIEHKAGYVIVISVDEGSYKFFAYLHGISYEFTGESNYVNCSDKDPEEIKPKDQNFEEAAEKIVSIILKYKTIMWIIIIIVLVIILIVILFCYNIY